MVALSQKLKQLVRGLETICAFLNTEGGRVLFGVSPKGAIEGQQVSSQTIHEITQAFGRFEPPAVIKIDRVKIGKGREVLALNPKVDPETLPFTFDGRPYERVENTTRKMTQHRYESLLLQRVHSRKRWENQVEPEFQLKHLDKEEILRTREAAIQHLRITAETGTNIGEILDRLGLRIDGKITRAAMILYAKEPFPTFPQTRIKMGRFRGSTLTGDIVDNRQEHLNAFTALREGMAFLERRLPLSAHFPEGKIFREDRLLIPPAALREALLNAIMHRDYSAYDGYVAIPVFDDRVEIQSIGSLPPGITAKMLSGPHRSKPRNPLIAETFHRTGAVEIWGRGTNRVIDECRQAGVPTPIFAENNGAVTVTFPFPKQLGARVRDQAGTKLGLSRDQVVVLKAADQPQSIQVFMQKSGKSNRTKFRQQTLQPLLDSGLLAMTLPEKPTSPQQQYFTTEEGKKMVGRKQVSVKKVNEE